MSDATSLGCTGCGALYVAASAAPTRCPSCGREGLEPASLRARPSFERRLPRRISPEVAAQRIAAFVSSVWFPTPDLAPDRLKQRLMPVWWPRWLVDVDAEGLWEAEVGFDYPVESSQEVYDGGRWISRKVTETRVRWEPRLGRVRRRYDNLSVPALADEERRARRIGPLIDGGDEPCPEQVDGAVLLPDRAQEDQWPAVLSALRERVGEDCGRAAGADHVRELFLDVDASGAHWSLLLVPGYATWYTDDDGKARVLFVHGASGRVGGPRMASPAAGRRWAGIWFGSGAAIAVFGLLVGLVGLVIWVLLPIAGLAVFGGALVGLVGLWPLLVPAQHNQGELAQETGAEPS